MAEFQYNNHVHASSQQTPFLLNCGQHPRMGFEPKQLARIEAVNEFTDRMKLALEEAKAALNKAKDDMARYYNQRRLPTPTYKPGDKVYLDASNIRTTWQKQTYPAALIEDTVDHEEDRTRYPIPDWYPPDAIIITAEEQKIFEEYARNLLANPVSKIHKTMKCLNAQINHVEIDIGQIEFDTSQEEFDDNALLISYINGKATEELDDIWINLTMSHSQAFAVKYEGNIQDEHIDLKNTIPTEFHEYLDVFSDEKSAWFPKSTPWDHKIEIKEGFQPQSFKVYPMTPKEDTMTKEFIDDNLKKDFIRPLKSPMATPFFFVHKKGTTKKRPCQDY
jgi:hypothetical protein